MRFELQDVPVLVFEVFGGSVRVLQVAFDLVEHLDPSLGHVLGHSLDCGDQEAFISVTPRAASDRRSVAAELFLFVRAGACGGRGGVPRVVGIFQCSRRQTTGTTRLGAVEAGILIQSVPLVRHLEIAEHVSRLFGPPGVHQGEDLDIEFLGNLDTMAAHTGLHVEYESVRDTDHHLRTETHRPQARAIA